jgi:hypothetical protein
VRYTQISVLNAKLSVTIAVLIDRDWNDPAAGRVSLSEPEDWTQDLKNGLAAKVIPSGHKIASGRVPQPS